MSLIVVLTQEWIEENDGMVQLEEIARSSVVLPMPSSARFMRRKQLAVHVDFSVWPNWRDALRVLLRRSHDITRVSLSAWSEAQRAQTDDVLEIAVNELGEQEICSTAMLSVRAPQYLQNSPGDAAMDMRGHRSEDLVCSTALAEGEYGRIFVRSFEALVATTHADSVAVTGLHFGRHCFCTRCLARFHGYAWRSDWPRLPNGAIELCNPMLGKWRSGQVAEVIARLRTLARAHGKRLLFEAELSRDDLSLNSRENGQDHGLLRPHVDAFVLRQDPDVDLDELESSENTTVARYACGTIGADDYWHSIRLRNRDGLALDARRMRQCMFAAMRGGARRLWITPSHYLSPAHWQQLHEVMGEDPLFSTVVAE